MRFPPDLNLVKVIEKERLRRKNDSNLGKGEGREGEGREGEGREERGERREERRKGMTNAC